MGEPFVARIEQKNACADPSGSRSGIARGRGGLCSEEERAETDEGGDPEAEHPAQELGLEPVEPCGQLGLELRVEFGDPALPRHVELGQAPLPPGIRLGEPLSELRVESTEVQLVEFPQVSAIRRVHGVLKDSLRSLNHSTSSLVISSPNFS